MDDAKFWSIIDLLDWTKTGDDNAVLAPAVAELSKESVEEIQEFEDILAEKLYALDGEAYARNVGENSYEGPGSYFSPDAFLYSRCVVVANGKDFYQQVLADPTKMPQDMEFEAILYLTADAYRAKTGEEWTYVPKRSYETFSNTEGWS